MIPKRLGRDESTEQNNESAVLSLSTLRSGESNAQAPTKSGGDKSDEKISLFWRVFGGTILSIAALVAITIYNNMASALAELRGELARVNEARAELVKKDEFNARSTSMWNRIQELQAITLAVTSLKEQVTTLADRNGGASKEMKDALDGLRQNVNGLKDKLTNFEQHARVQDEDHQVLQKANVAIAALQEKATARDMQLKQSEDERKDMAKELQALRERLAKLEGQQEFKPAPKSGTSATSAGAKVPGLGQ